MNRFTTNTSFRERTPNYIPLPFDQLYQVLQQKQQNYDAAEDLEIKAKSAVSALSSPIPGYQQYLDSIKTTYLESATKLHNSTPDKGSSEFKRKLTELVSGVNADRKLQLIQRDSNKYLEYVKDKSDLIKNNKYSAWRDSSKDFTGVDANGNILPFTYAGLTPSVDVDKILHESILETPEEKGKRVVFNAKTNREITVEEQGKRADKLYNTMLSKLGQEGLLDYMEKNNLKSLKDVDKHLSSYAASVSNYTQNYSSKADFSEANYNLHKAAFIKDNEGEAINQSFIPNLPNPTYPSSILDDNVKEDGSFESSFEFSNMFGEGEFNGVSNTYNDNAEYYAEVIRNGKYFGLNSKQSLAAIKAGRNIASQGTIFLNEKQSDEAANLIGKNITNENVTLIKVDGGAAAPASAEERQDIFNNLTNPALKKDKTKGYVVNAALSDDNPYGVNSYIVNYGGTQYIASLGPTNQAGDRDKINLHELTKAKVSGKTAHVNNYKEYDNTGKLVALHKKADVVVNPITGQEKVIKSYGK